MASLQGCAITSRLIRGKLLPHPPSSSSAPSSLKLPSFFQRSIFLPAPTRSFHTSGRLSSSSGDGAQGRSANSPVSLVQGASRGIGLEFVRQLLTKRPSERVVATCRKPEAAAGLADLLDAFGPDRLVVLPLDVTLPETIEAAAAEVRNRFGRLDLLVNTAGILHEAGTLQPETSLTKVTAEALIRTYQVNAVGPILTAKAMWPLLKKGGGEGTGRPGAVIASLSARVGSIGDNSIGGWYSYRASKSALNQLNKTMSVEIGRKRDKIACILLHPGTVDTDLSKPFQRNVAEGKLFTQEYSVNKLLGIIDGILLEDNGKFFAWDGKEIPW